MIEEQEAMTFYNVIGPLSMLETWAKVHCWTLTLVVSLEKLAKLEPLGNLFFYYFIISH
jgi:hypothetical protein